FDPVHHPSYIEFFNRILTETTDAYTIEQKYQDELAYNPSYIEMYRRGNAYHGSHPCFMWYWGQRGREKTSRVIVVGADNAPLPALREPATGKPRLDVTAIFRGKNLMLIGSTGFVGKVALSMLLHRYPDVGRVYCLVRPGAGNTADERFYKKVASSEVFDPVRQIHGDRFEEWMRTKIVALPGD